MEYFMATLWYKCQGSIWCELTKLDLQHEVLKKAEGVFIIWSGTKERKVLKVGSGLIRAALMNARTDISIQAFVNHGVFVTWADVGALKRSGVELYLINHLKPLIVPVTPKAIPIKIKLPWED